MTDPSGAAAPPKPFPPPEFPPRKAARFARTPPVIFPPILGALALAGAVRLSLDRLGWDRGPGELLAGLALALWAFAAFAYLAKLVRRPRVVVEDLRVLPGRAGLAALTMGGMAAAALLSPYLPRVAAGLLSLALLGHLTLAVLLIRLLRRPETPSRSINPTWHVSFVGFIVAAPGSVVLGLPLLAEGLFWATLPVALAIWSLSALDHRRTGLPPAPLRPLLVIHLAPASLLAITASLLGLPQLASVLLGLAAFYGLILLVAVRWLTASGPSPLWGGFTFPLGALAAAMLVVGGGWQWPGLGLTAVALVVIPALMWWVLQRWPGGRLAAMTNAAEA